MNELAIIFDKIGIDTAEVLKGFIDVKPCFEAKDFEAVGVRVWRL